MVTYDDLTKTIEYVDSCVNIIKSRLKEKADDEIDTDLIKKLEYLLAYKRYIKKEMQILVSEDTARYLFFSKMFLENEGITDDGIIL